MQAGRARQKAARAYAQPYLAIGLGGLVLSCAAIGLVLFTPRFRHMVWLESATLIPTQLLLIIAGVRIGLYLQRHPFDPRHE